jgi:hypothetical protein
MTRKRAETEGKKSKKEGPRQDSNLGPLVFKLATQNKNDKPLHYAGGCDFLVSYCFYTAIMLTMMAEEV